MSYPLAFRRGRGDSGSGHGTVLSLGKGLPSLKRRRGFSRAEVSAYWVPTSAGKLYTDRFPCERGFTCALSVVPRPRDHGAGGGTSEGHPRHEGRGHGERLERLHSSEDGKSVRVLVRVPPRFVTGVSGLGPSTGCRVSRGWGWG